VLWYSVVRSQGLVLCLEGAVCFGSFRNGCCSGILPFRRFLVGVARGLVALVFQKGVWKPPSARSLRLNAEWLESGSVAGGGPGEVFDGMSRWSLPARLLVIVQVPWLLLRCWPQTSAEFDGFR
jgi:hypothetical protein